MKHIEISEILAGLVLTGKMSPDYVIPSYLAAPYDIIISKSKEGRTPAELLDMVGLMPITAAREAASVVKFTDNTISELLTALMSAYKRQEQIATFKEQIKVLERGDNLETDKIVALMDKTEDYKGKYVKMNEIEDTSPIWRKIYYEPIDSHVGDPGDATMTGVPESGLTIIGGPPGCLAGHTTLKYNRGGITRTTTLKRLFDGLQGKKYMNGRPWDLTIPTYLQSAHDDGTIRLNEVERVVYSGEKEVYELVLDNGNSITGTADHPILTDTGWVGIAELNKDDSVVVNIGRNSRGRTKPNYLSKEGLKYHPYAGRVKQGRYAVPLHRLIYEAEKLNDINVHAFIEVCRTVSCNKLNFLSPEYIVHHIDGDTYNNNIENLECLTVEQHHKLHAEYTYRNVLEQTGYASVVGVEHIGVMPTYDVYMKDDPHNFIAENIVVHNTGKTSLIASMIAGCAEAGKKVLVYTLEMTTGQIARRIIQVATNGLTEEQKSNVVICGEILSADEVYADAMRLCATMNIYAVFIDFSDLLIEREEDEQSMAYVYRRCAMLAKRNTVGAPVILLSQLNRQYTGGIPRINNLRYSGLAEALGALIFLIYNPNQIFATQGSDDRLPAIPGRGYIIVGKSRFGYREGSPGAIQVDFDGKTSWGRASYGWFNLNSV